MCIFVKIDDAGYLLASISFHCSKINFAVDFNASFKVIKIARCVLISNQIEWNLTSERNLSRAFRNYENRNVVMVITVKPCWCVDTSGSRLLVLMGETSRKRTEGENAVKTIHPVDRVETSDRCD